MRRNRNLQFSIHLKVSYLFADLDRTRIKSDICRFRSAQKLLPVTVKYGVFKKCKGVIWPHRRENNRDIRLLVVSNLPTP